MSASGASNAAAERSGALQDVVILDAATLGAAPWIATYLSEFGAEVIKLEQPRGGDPLRGWGFQRDGVGLAWKSAARNKRSVTVDLHHELGQQLFRRLIEHVDVLLLNFRPGRMEKWGLPYEELCCDQPRPDRRSRNSVRLDRPLRSAPGLRDSGGGYERVRPHHW